MGDSSHAQDLPADFEDLDPAALISDLGPEAQLVTLYRADPAAPSRFAYLDSFPADGFSLDAVRNTYGGGTYRLHIRNGARQVKKQFGFSIAGLPKNPTPQPTDAQPTRATQTESQELREVVRALQDTVKSLAAAQARPAADPMQTAVQLLGVMQAAQAAAVQQFRDVSDAGGSKRGMSLQDMRELLQEGIRLGEERASAGAGQADPLVDLAGKLGPQLLTLIERGLAQERGRPVPGALPPGVVGTIPPAPQPPAAEGADVPDWARRLRPWGAQLAYMARQDADPEPLSETIAQILPAGDVGQLCALLAQPDALQQVLQAVPELAPYEGWCDRLLVALAERWEIPAGGEGDDTTPAAPAATA